MAARKRAAKHKDLEFQVKDRTFRSFEEAAAHAVVVSATSGEPAHIDVITWSRGAAKAWAGDYGMEVYEEDPEASVHDRIVVRAQAQGRIA